MGSQTNRFKDMSYFQKCTGAIAREIRLTRLVYGFSSITRKTSSSISGAETDLGRP